MIYLCEVCGKEMFNTKKVRCYDCGCYGDLIGEGTQSPAAPKCKHTYIDGTQCNEATGKFGYCDEHRYMAARGCLPAAPGALSSEEAVARLRGRGDYSRAPYVLKRRAEVVCPKCGTTGLHYALRPAGREGDPELPTFLICLACDSIEQQYVGDVPDDSAEDDRGRLRNRSEYAGLFEEVRRELDRCAIRWTERPSSLARWIDLLDHIVDAMRPADDDRMAKDMLIQLATAVFAAIEALDKETSDGHSQ